MEKSLKGESGSEEDTVSNRPSAARGLVVVVDVEGGAHGGVVEVVLTSHAADRVPGVPERI